MFDFEFDVAYTYFFVVLIIMVVLYVLTRQPAFNPPPQQVKISGDFTLEQLKQYDGVTKPQVFLAAKGKIYDVTHSQFYKKDGPYGVFSGHDASINLSKMSHDQNLLNKWGNYTINEDEEKILDDWVKRFQEKYRVVGNVKDFIKIAQ